jgi:uncharacterized membrane protein
VPDIGMFHPQVVHFVIALLFVGVIARIVSVIPMGGRLAFAGPMAALLILLGTAATVIAAKSGTDAHEKAESIPGVRAAVQDHERWGERTRNIFLGIAAVELLALVLAGKPKVAQGLRILSAVAGVGGLWAVTEVGDLGGDIVYEYAGGVGVRSGDTTDVRRMLVAALYNNLHVDRQAGNKADAARLADELVRRMPNDPAIRMLGIESTLRDKGDARGALAALEALHPAADNRRGIFQKAMMTSDAYVALGLNDSARLTLEALKAKSPPGPGQQRVQAAIDRIPASSAAPAATAPAAPAVRR